MDQSLNSTAFTASTSRGSGGGTSRDDETGVNTSRDSEETLRDDDEPLTEAPTVPSQASVAPLASNLPFSGSQFQIYYNGSLRSMLDGSSGSYFSQRSQPVLQGLSKAESMVAAAPEIRLQILVAVAFCSWLLKKRVGDYFDEDGRDAKATLWGYGTEGVPKRLDSLTVEELKAQGDIYVAKLELKRPFTASLKGRLTLSADQRKAEEERKYKKSVVEDWDKVTGLLNTIG